METVQGVNRIALDPNKAQAEYRDPRLRLAGVSAPKIADVLDRAGIPPRSGSSWSTDSIRHICASMGFKLGGRS